MTRVAPGWSCVAAQPPSIEARETRAKTGRMRMTVPFFRAKGRCSARGIVSLSVAGTARFAHGYETDSPLLPVDFLLLSCCGGTAPAGDPRAQEKGRGR